MAIDDIIIKNSACGAPANCNFNNDYCSYFVNDTSDFAWLLGTGRVVNTQLVDNPPVDNSVENGKCAAEYLHCIQKLKKKMYLSVYLETSVKKFFF